MQRLINLPQPASSAPEGKRTANLADLIRFYGVKFETFTRCRLNGNKGTAYLLIASLTSKQKHDFTTEYNNLLWCIHSRSGRTLLFVGDKAYK